MESKRRFFRGLRRGRKTQSAQGSIDSDGPAPKEIPESAIATLISKALESTPPLSRHDQHSPAPTQTNQTPAQKHEALWNQAYTSLRQSNPDLIETYEALLLDTDFSNLGKQEQMAAMVKRKQEILESKQWTVKISGKPVKAKDQVKRIIEAFKKVKDFGAAIASIDPMHAGLPWAGVSFLLGLVSKDFEQNEALLDGLKKISEIMARYRYTEAESVLLNNSAAENLDNKLELGIVKLYTCIFKFQATTACHLSHSTLTRFMRNLPKLDNWGELLAEVTSEDDNCYKWIGIQDSRELRMINERMNMLVPTQNSMMPSYFEVPMGRKIPRFIGRKDILTRIGSAHSKGLSSRAGIVVLRGLGGQGKTQIALEYCHISRDTFKPVFWADASSEGSVTESFGIIYAKIKGPGDVCDSNEAKLEFVKTAFRNWNSRWLIVFDNYDTPGNFSLEAFIPHSAHGSVLVTTRHKDVDELVEDDNAAIELLGLPEKEALELLCQQSGKKENEVDKENGFRIVERLGYHALAITQAGTYIKNLKLDFSAFQSHYSSQRREAILKYQIPMNKYTKYLSETERETAFNVFTTWEISFNELKVQKNSAALEKLLTIFAFFDSADIPEELFSIRARYVDLEREEPEPQEYQAQESSLFEKNFALFLNATGVWDSNIFGDALQVLESLSLIQSFVLIKDNYHISLHPLVKDWIRLRTDSQTCELCTILAANIIESYLLSASRANINSTMRQVALANISAHEDNIGYITIPATAVVSTKRSIHEDLYFSELVMGRALRYMGFEQRARATLKRLFERQEKFHWDETWPTSCKIKEKIQRVLSELGLSEEELSISRQLYELNLRMHGSESVEAVRSRSILGKALAKADELEEAEKIQRQILEYNMKNKDDNDAETIESIIQLAETLEKCGRLNEAEELYHRVVILKEESHLGILRSKINLAKLLKRVGKIKEANELCTEILDGFEIGPSLGSNEGIQLIKDLRNTLVGLRRDGEALKLCRNVLNFTEERWGHLDMHTLYLIDILAHCYFENEELDEVEPLLNRACESAEKLFGDIHLFTFYFQRSYALILRYLGRRDRAEKLAKDVLRKVKEMDGEGSEVFREFNKEFFWLDEPSKIMLDLDVYFEGVFGDRNDVADEERYAAYRAFRAENEDYVSASEDECETDEENEDGSGEEGEEREEGSEEEVEYESGYDTENKESLSEDKCETDEGNEDGSGGRGKEEGASEEECGSESRDG
ncbi:hypothetical protein NHQ30_004610 [Ciborinia camelliae]|nr:hypothetical protein NHQ30_004610 [Ciborinia camelliae]